MTTQPISRRGFTLIELLLSLIVTAIVGAALVRMVLSQARFMDQQEAHRVARSVARSGINRLFSDLRAVEATGGLEAATAGGKDFTVRVPYAFGIMCSSAAGVTTLSLLPVDATMFNAVGYSGFAWRSPAGVYTYRASGVLPVLPGTSANCDNAVPLPITVVPAMNGSPAGLVVNVSGALLPIPLPAGMTAPPVGAIFFLYRRIRYEFKASVALPGRIGLWRTTLTGAGCPCGEELAAPFDVTARVNFYMLNTVAPTSTAPATPAERANVRGLELRLDGLSERTPGGSAGPKTAFVTTSVFFENRPD
jgi:prepilin-type N-terminal cleavage/methylation domain-containing protein